YGKTHATGAPVRETRQARQRGQRSARTSRERVASGQWKPIAVPALVTEEQFALVQERLERNRRFSPRNTQRPSLLQGILVCRECGYAYYRCSTRSPSGILREYYRCSGTDGRRRPEGRVCDNRPVRLAEVDELVWSRVLGLLDDPALIQTEIDRRLQTLRAAHPATARRDALERDLTRTQQALRRLIDGYQEQLLTLEELRARTPELRKREATLQAQLDALDAELHDAETYLKLTETLEGFRARLSANAEALTVEQRQQIIRHVVREVLIGEDDVTIRHSIPVPTRGQPPGYLLRLGSREDADPGAATHLPDRRANPRSSAADRARLRPWRRAVLPRRLGRPPRPAIRPLRAANRDRAIRPADRAGHDQRALPQRPACVLDRRQRLIAPRTGLNRAAPGRMAEPRARPPPIPRVMAEPDRARVLRHPAQGPDPERLSQPASDRRPPRQLRAPLQPDRHAIRLDLHPRRSRETHHSRRQSRAAAQTRGLITHELTTKTTKPSLRFVDEEVVMLPECASPIA